MAYSIWQNYFCKFVLPFNNLLQNGSRAWAVIGPVLILHLSIDSRAAQGFGLVMAAKFKFRLVGCRFKPDLSNAYLEFTVLKCIIYS